MAKENHNWIYDGRGRAPEVTWSFQADGSLTDMFVTRESSETYVSDDIGGVYRLDAKGRVALLTRVSPHAKQLVWADTGEFGAALMGENILCRFDRQLRSLWEIEISTECLSIAIDPYGTFIAVSFSDGGNVIFDPRRKKVAVFETMRPLKYMQFSVEEPVLFGAAEHGLLGCYDVGGKKIWEEKTWSNVGDLCHSPESGQLFLAGMMHGVMVFDEQGQSESIVQAGGTDGHTVNAVSTDYLGRVMAVSTVEQSIHWIDHDGEQIWAATTPSPIFRMKSDALGRGMQIGFKHGAVSALRWKPQKL